MNILRTISKQERPGSYLIFWTNTTIKPLTQKGCVRIEVNSSDPDGAIIAELHAIQYLLEIAEVVGENRAGDKFLTLIVSAGAIRKLARMDSVKKDLAEHAIFLTTRFSGCNIKVEKDDRWIVPSCEPSITLDSSIRLDETVTMPVIGKVWITAHVVEQFAERFGVTSSFGDAWRKLTKIASDERIREVDLRSAKTKLKYSLQGKEVGRYFYHPTQHAVLVVVNDKKRNKPVLVTAYKEEDSLMA